jgi:hypothetical protein
VPDHHASSPERRERRRELRTGWHVALGGVGRTTGKRTYWPPLALVFTSLDELLMLKRMNSRCEANVKTTREDMMEYGDFLADFSKRTLVNLRALKKNKFKVTAEIVGLIALLAMYREYDEIIERQHRPRHAEFLAKLKGLLADDKPKPPSDARLMMQGLKHALVHFDFRPVHADGKVRGIVFSNRKNRGGGGPTGRSAERRLEGDT